MSKRKTVRFCRRPVVVDLGEMATHSFSRRQERVGVNSGFCAVAGLPLPVSLIKAAVADVRSLSSTW